MGDQLMLPLPRMKPLEHHDSMVPTDLMEARNWAVIMPRGVASQTADGNFSSLGTTFFGGSWRQRFGMEFFPSYVVWEANAIYLFIYILIMFTDLEVQIKDHK